MNNMFSFFTFYKHVFKKDDKKYDIAMDSSKYVVAFMTPLTLFIVSMIAYAVMGGIPVFTSIVLLISLVNCFILNYTRLRGHEILVERKEEMEKLAREEIAKGKFNNK